MLRRIFVWGGHRGHMVVYGAGRGRGLCGGRQEVNCAAKRLYGIMIQVFYA